MHKTIAIIAVLAAAVIIGISASAKAGPAPQPILSDATSPPVVHLTRAARSGTLKLSTTQSSGPCGVWRCTWPISGGGCLVWEKTKCKVINPFD